MFAVTFAPEALIASASALKVWLVGVIVNGVPPTVSVSEPDVVMDCEEGSVTAGSGARLIALVGAPWLTTWIEYVPGQCTRIAMRGHDVGIGNACRGRVRRCRNALYRGEHGRELPVQGVQRVGTALQSRELIVQQVKRQRRNRNGARRAPAEGRWSTGWLPVKMLEIGTHWIAVTALAATKNKTGPFSVENRPRLFKTLGLPYDRSFKSACGAALAWARAATEDCSRICALVRLAASVATSASRIDDCAAEKLEICDCASCTA